MTSVGRKQKLFLRFINPDGFLIDEKIFRRRFMANYLYSSNLNHIHFVISNLHHDNSIIKVSKNILKIKKYTRNYITKYSKRFHTRKTTLLKKNILRKMYYLSSF